MAGPSRLPEPSVLLSLSEPDVPEEAASACPGVTAAEGIGAEVIGAIAGTGAAPVADVGDVADTAGALAAGALAAERTLAAAARSLLASPRLASAVRSPSVLIPPL